MSCMSHNAARRRERSLILRFQTGALLRAGIAVAAGIASTAVAEDRQQPQAIYRYTNRHGRTVYVNGIERVPPQQRRKARPLDLSHISLNRELGADLKQAVDEQLSWMLDSDYCESLRRRADGPWWRAAWRGNGHLIAIAAVLLAFLIGSPYLIRTIGAPRWGKLLLLLLPLLGFIAISSTVAVKASQSLAQLRTAADPCRHDFYQKPANDPAAQASRLHLVQKLQQQISSAHVLHNKQLQQALEH